MNRPLMLAQPTRDPLALAPDEARWVEDRLGAMSPAEQAAQLLMPLVPGGARREPFIERCIQLGVGGIFHPTLPATEVRAMAERLDQGLRIAPLIAGDYECGAALAGAPGMGTAMALAAIADLDEACDAAEALGRSTAEQGRAVGCRWTFAPVVDINTDPDNPIANTRSYGDDPARIAAIATAFVEGAQAAGMAATPKHFPGDGRDRRDQHLVTTINPLPFGYWDATNGEVFRQVFAAGAMTCMVGHIALRGRSTRGPDGRMLPATLDPAIQRGLLREELGFQGVIVSDAIGMMGMRGHLPREVDRVVANLAAGSDVVLFPEDPQAAVAAILLALADGRLDAGELQASVRRVLAMKAKLGLHRPGWLPDAAESSALLAPQRHQRVCERIAERSVTLLRDRAGVLPLRLAPGAQVLVYRLPDEPFGGATLVVAGQDLGDDLAAMLDSFRTAGLNVDVAAGRTEYAAKLAHADAVVCLVRNRPQAGRGSVRLSYEAMQCLENMWGDRPAPRDIPKVWCLLGSPYAAWEASWLPTVLCAYAQTPSSLRTLARVILGSQEAPGALPVRLPQE